MKGRKTGGRHRGTPNKRTVDLQALTRPYAGKVVAMLLAIVDSDSAPLAVKVVAGKELLDRGYGKPAQAVTGPEGGPLVMKQVIHQQLRDDRD
jgi:hypothetical protein